MMTLETAPKLRIQDLHRFSTLNLRRELFPLAWPSASSRFHPRNRLLTPWKSRCHELPTALENSMILSIPFLTFLRKCRMPTAIPKCTATANTGTSRRRGLVHPHLQLCLLLRLRPESLGSPFQLSHIRSSPAHATA